MKLILFKIFIIEFPCNSNPFNSIQMKYMNPMRVEFDHRAFCFHFSFFFQIYRYLHISMIAIEPYASIKYWINYKWEINLWKIHKFFKKKKKTIWKRKKSIEKTNHREKPIGASVLKFLSLFAAKWTTSKLLSVTLVIPVPSYSHQSDIAE